MWLIWWLACTSGSGQPEVEAASQEAVAPVAASVEEPEAPSDDPAPAPVEEEAGCKAHDATLLIEVPDGADLYTLGKDCGTGGCSETLLHACKTEGHFRSVAQVDSNNSPVRLGARKRGGHPDLLVDMDRKQQAGPRTGEFAGFELLAWVWKDDAYVRVERAKPVEGHEDYALRKLPVSGGACDQYWLQHRGSDGRWTVLQEGVLREQRMAWSEDGIPAGFDSCPENLEGVFAGAHYVKVSDPEYANKVSWDGATVVVSDGSTEARFAYSADGLVAIEE